MPASSLFEPLKLGRYTLAHRVVMAPLTRQRATPPGNVPNALNVKYYSQRASKGGLLITEATQVTPTGQGYPTTPGIHAQGQVEGWRKVTNAVHAKGGHIFLQLWHVGRISHSSFQPNGGPPLAPSAVKPEGMVMNKDRQQVPYETPRAIELDEIPGIVAAYAQGARNALAAGFDGVEVHGANGYLLQQFLETKTNLRTDAYGGSIENRFRLMREVVAEVVEVWGADRVGIRLSPFASVNDSGEADPQTLYTYVVSELAKFNLAYVHLIEARDAAGENPHTPQFDALRKLWPNALIAASGFKPETALAAVQAGRADAVAFGRWFIANPDLPERIQRNAPLNPYDRTTFYGGNEKGYTDYPALEASPA